jgi:hypothetical protein
MCKNTVNIDYVLIAFQAIKNILNTNHVFVYFTVYHLITSNKYLLILCN